MFLKVLKLLIKSRFSKSFLFIILMIFIYSIYTIAIGSGYNEFSLYYLAFIFLIFLVSATMVGGLSLTAADRDFLLTSAVRNRVLIPAFFIAQALASSILFIAAASGAIILFRGNSFELMVGIVAIICMAILPISMSLNMAGRNNYVKGFFSAAESGWVILSFTSFPYGALSFLVDGNLSSSTILISITIIATAVSSLNIRAESLPFRISSFSMRNRTSFKKSFTFTGLSRDSAILKLNFRQIDFTSRVASMGNIRVRINRVGIYTMFLIVSILAVAFTVFMFLYGKKIGPSFFTFILSAYIVWLLSLAFSTGTLSKERAWLSFTSMPVESYLRMVMFAKMLQTLFISVPFALSSIIVGIYIDRSFIPLAGVILMFPPVFTGINFSLSFIRSPYQILQEDILPSVYNASQFALFPISFGMLLILFVVILLPVSTIPVFAASVIFLLFLSWRQDYWKNHLYSWIERGYQ